MVAEVTPDYEMTRRLVALFSEDATVQELLYPQWAEPKQNDLDSRIYDAHADIRHPAIIGILPRIIIDARILDNDWEQVDSAKSGPVIVHVHCLSRKDQYRTALLLDTRIRTIVSSTYLTDSRIIASELVQQGERREFVDKLFDDAWRLVTTYRAANVGVLV